MGWKRGVQRIWNVQNNGHWLKTYKPSVTYSRIVRQPIGYGGHNNQKVETFTIPTVTKNSFLLTGHLVYLAYGHTDIASVHTGQFEICTLQVSDCVSDGAQVKVCQHGINHAGKLEAHGQRRGSRGTQMTSLRYFNRIKKNPYINCNI